MEKHANDLDLDIDLDQFLRQRIDVDKTRVDCAIEATEFGDETDISLADSLVWVRADDAAGNGAHATDEGTESAD